MNKKTVLLLSVLMITQTAFAQGTDFMRSTGKIYVVVAVIIAILIGLFIFLFRIERKLTKLEHQIKGNE